MSKVAVVTGGSKGIGFAVVQRLLTSGYQVHNLDIEPSASGVFHQCDVSNVTAVRQCIQAIIEKTQRIDVLVSNAGKHLSATIEQTDEATFDALMALNVKGAYAAIQSVLPAMKAQQDDVHCLFPS